MTIGPLLLALAPVTVAGIFNLVAARSNRRKLDEIHVQMNGELAKRIAAEVKLAFAEGVKSETDKKL